MQKVCHSSRYISEVENSSTGKVVLQFNMKSELCVQHYQVLLVVVLVLGGGMFCCKNDDHKVFISHGPLIGAVSIKPRLSIGLSSWAHNSKGYKYFSDDERLSVRQRESENKNTLK